MSNYQLGGDYKPILQHLDQTIGYFTNKHKGWPEPAPEDPGEIEIPADLVAKTQALDLVLQPGPVSHIMGRAGCGKSYLIKEIAETLESLGKNFALVAPTGIAAMQIGGTTIHSFFRIPLHVVTAKDILKQRKTDQFCNLDILIIDECSMVRADVLDGIDLCLRHHTGDSRPFGGVKIVLVGDSFQLPPVLCEEETDAFFALGYRGPHFFQAHVLEDMEIKFLELKTSFRHNDPAFLEMLDCIRLKQNLDRVLPEINSRVGQSPEGGPALLTLTCRREAARLINQFEMSRLPGPYAEFKGEVIGSFRFQEDYKLPVPKVLRLKIGARVMFARNHPFGLWSNGTIGTVRNLSQHEIEVELETLRPGERLKVPMASWGDFRYRFDPFENRLVPVQVGWLKQFPLLPAWAITVHRSQGCTLDRVKLDFGGGAFAHGQAYGAIRDQRPKLHAYHEIWSVLARLQKRSRLRR